MPTSSKFLCALRRGIPLLAREKRRELDRLNRVGKLSTGASALMPSAAGGDCA